MQGFRKVSAWAVAMIVLVLGNHGIHAQSEANRLVALNPTEADSDFAYQGEYRGELLRDGQPTPWGAQIVALGGGRFLGVGYPGGLPGDGWTGEERTEIEGRLLQGEVRFEHEGIVAILREGRLKVSANGEMLGVLTHVERKSPTLGAKPPRGAVVLFDGTAADHFENGKTTSEGWLMQGVVSKLKHQDAQVHLEFMLPYMPYARGQARANSGCYLQGRYEVQILDSFGLQGKHNECGGIYEIRDPDINMCYPPLSWQTYDIDFKAARYDESGKKTADARMTVRHNGVVVHRDVPVPRATRASILPEGPQPGPLYLQDHGNPVRFRNIWILLSSQP